MNDDAKQNDDEDMGGTTTTPPATGISALIEALDCLKDTKAEFEEQTVDANIAELQKLIDELIAAEESYAKAYPDLQQHQDDLENFKVWTVPDLLKNCLPPDAEAQIAAIVDDALKGVEDAKGDIRRLKGYPQKSRAGAWTYTPGEIDKARWDLSELTPVFEAAEKRLSDLRAIEKSVGERHKKLDKLRDEILALSQSKSQPGSAYWLLTGSELADSTGDVVLSGENLFSGLLCRCSHVPAPRKAADAPPGPCDTASDAACPEVVAPDELNTKTEAAWNAFAAARRAKEAKAQELADLEAELKDAQKTYAKLTKDLMKTIREHLADFDKNRVDPTGNPAE